LLTKGWLVGYFWFNLFSKKVGWLVIFGSTFFLKRLVGWLFLVQPFSKRLVGWLFLVQPFSKRLLKRLGCGKAFFFLSKNTLNINDVGTEKI
jgi:hypothetical protein